MFCNMFFGKKAQRVIRNLRIDTASVTGGKSAQKGLEIYKKSLNVSLMATLVVKNKTI